VKKYKIDKKIPIPARSARGGSKKLYPFSKMKIGDSFDAGESILIARATASAYGSRHEMAFTSRGTRIWRTA